MATSDQIVAIYHAAEDLKRAGKLDEACTKYREGYDICLANQDHDSESRSKIFAAKLAELLYRLERHEESLPFFAASGMTAPKIVNLKSFGAGIKVLRKLGYLSDLTPAKTKEICEDPEEDGGAIPTALIAYYDHGLEGETQPQSSRVTPVTPRALKDGVTMYDHRFANDSDDVIADFAELIGGTPYYKAIQLEFSNSPFVVIVENEQGQQENWDIDDIYDIVAKFNQKLESNKDDRRFISVDTYADFSFWMLVTLDVLKKLVRSKPAVFGFESIPGIEDKKWTGKK
ncbi:MAG TPA: tetratricopeptide repeat protein [Drouetiella sp.]